MWVRVFLSHNDTQHNYFQQNNIKYNNINDNHQIYTQNYVTTFARLSLVYAECHILILMLSVIMSSVH
jgi:hypothetical protein